MIDRSGQYHAALASTSRRWVLDALLACPEPLDAVAVAVVVADHLGTHLTTARFHFDQLTAAGLIPRRADTMKRRGRPRLLYAPAGLARDGHAHEQLIQVLDGATRQARLIPFVETELCVVALERAGSHVGEARP